MVPGVRANHQRKEGRKDPTRFVESQKAAAEKSVLQMFEYILRIALHEMFAHVSNYRMFMAIWIIACYQII